MGRLAVSESETADRRQSFWTDKHSGLRDTVHEYGPYVAVSAILTKEDDSPWTDEELFPIESISYGDRDGYGAYGPVTLAMKDGRTMVVDYNGLEGHLML